MKSSANISPNRPSEGQEIPLGIRERIMALFGFGAPAEKSISEPLKELMSHLSLSDEQVPRIQAVLAKHPEINDSITQLLDPELPIDEAFGLIHDLNEKYGPTTEERHGRYFVTSFSLPNRSQLRIKLFPDSGDAMSFALGRL